MAFIDIKKAYDSVARRKLWERLRRMGLGGLFLGMLRGLYSEDNFITEMNGVTSRRIYLGRGVRQGCSLSPLLFALYLVEWGRSLEGSSDGFKVGNLIISGLLFADDLVVCSPTPEGLARLLKLCQRRAAELQLTISLKKSMVLSPSMNAWELLDENEEVYACLGKVASYKYLGLETFSSLYKTSTAKQLKAVSAARKYRAATRYLSRRGPDVVDVAVCAWRNVALSALLFGVETVVFSESTIKKLEAEQPRPPL
jgi:hypothetical protein